MMRRLLEVLGARLGLVSLQLCLKLTFVLSLAQEISISFVCSA